MSDTEKRNYQLKVVRVVQDLWEKAVIYQGYEASYEKWLNTYLDELEASDRFEPLQAFIDYHKNDNKDKPKTSIPPRRGN